jgi:uncharacterized membrane protein
MKERLELSNNEHWRTAVWALRVGYLALLVAIVGLIMVAAGATPWVLAAAVIMWIILSVLTQTMFFRARADLPRPHPGYWSLRYTLIFDSVHPRAFAKRI